MSKKNKIILEREFLIELRDEAERMARTPHLNESWKRVYLRLADAASELDAYEARTEVHDDIDKIPIEDQ